jgi:hypothetical protein
MPKVGLSPDDRHYFGLNRVEQTGEELDFGFRTSTWFVLPKPNDRLDPRSFKPSESIATPNALAITPFRIEKVDESYPFCQENSRTNRVEARDDGGERDLQGSQYVIVRHHIMPY